MLPTPSTSHVNYDRVYEPAEDSFLLLDTLSSETESAFLKARFPADSPAPLGLEVGTGSGVVLAFLTAHADRILGRSDVMTLGVDVSNFAVRASKETIVNANKDAAQAGTIPGLFADCLIADLTPAIKPGSVDILVFNPPYVPSETVPGVLLELSDGSNNNPFAQDSNLLALATDGGIDGMQVTDRLLSELPELLSDRGIAYVLLCAGNKPEKVMQTIRSWRSEGAQAWSAERVASSGRKAGWEKLCIIRIYRSNVESHPAGITP